MQITIEKLRLYGFYKLIKYLGIELIGGHFLYTRYLHSQSVIVDAGANIGHFSVAINQKLGCRCIAIEPVGEYLAQIPDITGIEKVNAVLAGSNGKSRVWVSDNLEGSSIIQHITERAGSRADAIDVNSFSWNGLTSAYNIAQCDVLKMDIEGAEIAVLDGMDDPTLKSISQIIVEFHDFIYPEQLPDIQRILKRLKLLGFIPIRASRNHLMDMIFLNTKALDLGGFWYATYHLYKKFEFPFEKFRV